MTYSEYRKAWLDEYPNMPEEEIQAFWEEIVDYEKRQENEWKKITENYDLYDEFAREKTTGRWCPLEAV